MKHKRLLLLVAGAGIAVSVAAMLGLANHNAHATNPPEGISEPARVETNTIVALSTLPAPRGTDLRPVPREVSLSPARVIALGNGDTLIAALQRSGIAKWEAYEASKALQVAYDPRDLKAGQKLRLFIGEHDNIEDGPSLERLEIVPETDLLVSVDHQQDEYYTMRTSKVPHVRKLVSRAGTIQSSLYEAALAEKVPAKVLIQTYGTLSYGLDFQRDIQAGDTFQVAYQVFDDALGQGRHPGDLVFAALDTTERGLRIYYYTTTDGFAGFFDDNGTSIETTLMTTPVDGGQLSSLFGKRDHPVLGYTRMHRGIDFTAPRGTPVLAAGDGLVARRERNGSFGNYVEIKHDKSYATAYAHLNRYAQGLKAGDRVRQGDVIGFVGATGLATGSNLHYEILQNGKQVDPMRLELPPRKKLEGEELLRFEQAKAELLAALGRAG